MHAYLLCFLKNKNGVVFVNLVNVVTTSMYKLSHHSINYYYLNSLIGCPMEDYVRF